MSFFNHSYVRNLVASQIAVVIVVALFWSQLSKAEGYLHPVVSHLTVTSTERDTATGALLIDGVFSKYRNCQFKGISWYDSTNLRLRFEFPPNPASTAVSRPEGGQRVVGWRLFGVTTLDDVYAVVVHECHPLWRVETTFFVGEKVE